MAILAKMEMTRVNKLTQLEGPCNAGKNGPFGKWQFWQNFVMVAMLIKFCQGYRQNYK